MKTNAKFKIVNSPFDLHNASFQDGEVVYDRTTKSCYIYAAGEFKDITNTVDSAQIKHEQREREDVLICKSCGARLLSARCSYCGTFSWTARDYFE